MNEFKKYLVTWELTPDGEPLITQTSKLLPVRYKNLSGVYCLLLGCDDPICIHKLFDGFFLENNTNVDFDRHFVLEENECKAR